MKRTNKSITTESVWRFNWRPLDEKGRLEWIDKEDLEVDPIYQRTPYESKINALAAEWSWMACGTIAVACRPDLSFFVYDGNHRVCAARKRDDITLLPCWVFDVPEVRHEARAFVDTNTNRKNMSAIQKFTARLESEDPGALAVQDMVESVGYQVTNKGDFAIQCVTELERTLKIDEEAANLALNLCSDLHDGQVITRDVYFAIFGLEIHLKSQGQTVLRNDIVRKLRSVAPRDLFLKIKKAKEFHGGAGQKVCVSGLVAFINKGKTSNRILDPAQA